MDTSRFPTKRVVAVIEMRHPAFGVHRCYTLECGHRVDQKEGFALLDKVPCKQCFETSFNRRAWKPEHMLTDSGLVMTPEHVRNVRSLKERIAVALTDNIIYKIIGRE